MSTKPEIEIDFRDVQNLILAVCDCGEHIFPWKNANFGRFEVAFDRPEFDRTQVLVIIIIIIIIIYYYYILIFEKDKSKYRLLLDFHHNEQLLVCDCGFRLSPFFSNLYNPVIIYSSSNSGLQCTVGIIISCSTIWHSCEVLSLSIWTTHEEHLLVFVTVQNLVGIGAVVSILCHF